MNQEEQLINFLDEVCKLGEYGIILADGRFPKNEYLQRLIKNTTNLICCDGAVNKLERLGKLPDFIIGDCDSIADNLFEIYRDKIITIEEQDTNDLTKAINFAKNQLKLDNIIILGATGIREDHTLANISLLLEYSKIVNKVILISDYGVFNVCFDKIELAVIIGQQVSLFAISNNTIVSTDGLKWELDNFTLNSWYRGTLNQAITTSITIKSSEPMLIYRSFTVRNS